MRNKSTKGFTLVEIMIVVAIIGLLSAVAIPNFVKARAKATSTACISNLKQIYGAKFVYAIDKKQSDIITIDWSALVPNYIKRTPNCPGSGSYTLGIINVTPTCTLSSSGHTL